MLDGVVAVLEEEEHEVDHHAPATRQRRRRRRQIEPDVLLENGHVLVALHQLLDAHACAGHDRRADDGQKGRVNRKIAKGGRARPGELDRGDGVADQQHRGPVDAGESRDDEEGRDAPLPHENHRKHAHNHRF